MALDSIYKFKEIKKPTEISQQEELRKLDKLIDSLPTSDLDQQWVKEHEVKENTFSIPNQQNEEEQLLDDILANFKSLREKNNSMRSQMRKEQLNPVEQLNQTKAWLDSMTGGKSR